MIVPEWAEQVILGVVSVIFIGVMAIVIIDEIKERRK